MSFINSSTTIILEASLTDTGRKFLFGIDEKTQKPIRFNSSGQDLFLPKNFSLNDSDVNYKTSQKLESGDVPDIKGTKNGSFLKTCANSKRKNFLTSSKGFNPTVEFEKEQYQVLKNSYVPEYTSTINGTSQLPPSFNDLLDFEIKIDKFFNIKNGIDNLQFLVYIDTDNTTLELSNFTISSNIGGEFGNITYKNTKYFGSIITLYKASSDIFIDLKLKLLNTINVTTNDPKYVYLNIIPINGCDINLKGNTKIQINGDVPPSRGIQFESIGKTIPNNIADGVIVDYFKVILSEPEYKKAKTADLKMSLSPGLNPLRNNPLIIEVLNPTNSNQNIADSPLLSNSIMFSKAYVSTLVETEQTIPLTFDVGTDVIALKITRPYYLNIPSSQYINLSFLNTYRNTVQLPNNVATIRIG